MKFELSLTVDAIILTIALEFCSGGIFLTWTLYDAHAASQLDPRFHRPAAGPYASELDERFRRAQA